MKLSILERIVLQGLLPQEGNYVTFKIIKDLRNELGFSEAELKDFGIKQDGNSVVWNAARAKDKEVEIGDAARQVIVDALKKLDSENKINEENVGLYEKFIK